jgi:hypothetical protein
VRCRESTSDRVSQNALGHHEAYNNRVVERRRVADADYQLGHEADELERLNVQGRALGGRHVRSWRRPVFALVCASST